MSCSKCYKKSIYEIELKGNNCAVCGEPIRKSIKVLPESNNGGDTDYFDLDPLWTGCQDIIEARNMNYAQGNILKVAFCFNLGRHKGTNYERELNKLIWFAKRELESIKKD